jgi:hypothetical protein
MAKEKKKNKKKALNKALKPLITGFNNNRTLFSVLGAAAAGAALTAALTSDKGRVLFDRIAEYAKDMIGEDSLNQRSQVAVNGASKKVTASPA